LYCYVIAKETASPVWRIAPALWDAGSICLALSAIVRADPIGFAIEKK